MKFIVNSRQLKFANDVVKASTFFETSFSLFAYIMYANKERFFTDQIASSQEIFDK